MDRRVDPSSTLTQKYIPSTWRDCTGNSVRGEFHLVRREVLHHERGEVSIFSEREQILLVECVNIGFGVFVNDHRRDDNWPTFIGGSNSVDRETTGEARDGAEEGFKGFSEVMRDEVFVDLGSVGWL